MKSVFSKIIAIGIIIALPLGFFWYFQTHKIAPPTQLPVYSKVPYFQFTDQQGQKVSSDNLKNFIYVADFFFTTCPDMCPKLSAQMKNLEDKYSSEEELKLVSFSVDPEHDSVPVLKRYADKFLAVPGKWFFFTGDQKKIYDLGETGYKLPIVTIDSAGQQQFVHSDKFVLVDGNGNIRGYYSVLNGDFDKLVNDIEKLLVENNGSPASSTL
jgi:protein SCO1